MQDIVFCNLGTCSSIYVWMQFFYTPWWLILLGSMSFNLSSGALAMTYLFLNPTLRTAAFRLFCRIKSSKVESCTIGTANATHRPSLATGNII
ncbi:serpentine type 7TM GPCR chemoreceptor srt domain-containing protein [Ditylenchus destructor]|nr:serpentine type 7TM GPCR chemoreceptor srt domain-containing protein [Ditylenchus destructor]